MLLFAPAYSMYSVKEIPKHYNYRQGFEWTCPICTKRISESVLDDHRDRGCSRVDAVFPEKILENETEFAQCTASIIYSLFSLTLGLQVFNECIHRICISAKYNAVTGNLL